MFTSKGSGFSALLIMLLLTIPGVLFFHSRTEAEGDRIRQEVCDVPLLHVGDFWNYTVEASEETLGVDLSGYMNTTVSGFMFHNEGPPLYIMNSSSHLEGDFTYIIIRIHVNLEIQTTSYLSAEDLSAAESHTVLTLELDPDPISLSGTYYYNTTFSPPAEDLDFPLQPGKRWNISSSLDEGSTAYYNSSYEVRGTVDVTVPAGTFHCFEVYSPSQGASAFYSPEVRGYVRRQLSLALDTYSLTSELSLREFYVGEDPGVEPAPAPPYHTLPSKNITISFKNLSGEVHYSLWGTRGTFRSGTLNITSPPGPDNSPSNVDYGSFGLLLFSPSEGPLWVGSVVTHNTNLVALNVTPRVIELEEDEVAEVVAALQNPSTEPLVGNYTFSLDSVPLTGGSVLIPPGERRNISVSLPPLTPGEHTLLFIADPADLLEETSEEDNTVEFMITVQRRVEITLIERQPPGDEVWIREGEEVLFTVRIQCEDEANVTALWILSGETVARGFSFLFQADFNASEGSPYTVIFHASHPSGTQLFSNWTLHVENVNRPPVIRASPPPGELNLTEGGWLNFNAFASDPDGETVEIVWLLNGTLVGRGGVYNFSSAAPGVYELRVVATDGLDNASLSWLIKVRPQVPPARILSKSPNSTLVLLNEGENITFSVKLSPGGWHSTSYSWLLNGVKVATGPEYTFTAAYTGPLSSSGSPYLISFVAEFREGTLQVNWTLLVAEVNRDPVIENVTVQITEEWSDGGVYVNLTFTGYDPDGDPLNVTWSVDGEVVLRDYSGRVVLPPGRHVIILNVTDGRGGWSLQIRMVEVPKKENGGFLFNLPDLSDGGRSIVTIILMLLIVIVFIWVLLRSPPEGEEEYYE